MYVLVENSIGAQNELRHRSNQSGASGEGVGGVVGDVLMKHLRDRNAAGVGLVDQRLHILQERRQLIASPVRSLAKGLLDVDDNQCLLHGVPPLATHAS